MAHSDCARRRVCFYARARASSAGRNNGVDARSLSEEYASHACEQLLSHAELNAVQLYHSILSFVITNFYAGFTSNIAFSSIFLFRPTN